MSDFKAVNHVTFKLIQIPDSQTIAHPEEGELLMASVFLFLFSNTVVFLKLKAIYYG